VSKVRRTTSVVTVKRSLLLAGAAPEGGVAPGVTLGVAPAACGTAMGVAAPVAAGAEAVAAGLGAGKKVAGLPLATCHWSQSITIEKPKTTQRMERRMSFMRTSWIEGET